ncbi:hypothetical protein BX666DRAFT_2028747 [Dichotomocladium elegans]|nr:hypothetical protein BX666DRAFT_2028747 [Dichotomocladium elegans]
MASIIDISALANSRKRKQEFVSDASKTSSQPVWSDYVYSSPSPPLNAASIYASSDCIMPNNNPTTGSSFDFRLDAMYSQQGPISTTATAPTAPIHHYDHSFDFDRYNFDAHLPLTDAVSRRHSVAVGELDYYPVDSVKQELDVDLQRLLALPSSWSSSTSSATSNSNSSNASLPLDRSLAHQQQQKMTTTELGRPELETTTISSTGSPNTPAFFTPSFLDALNADEDKDASFVFHEDPLTLASSSPSASSADYLLHHNRQQCEDTATYGAVSGTVSPVVITNWLMEQPTAKTHVTTRPRHRGKSPPISPSNASSSSSPSPPVTPVQPTYATYDHHGYAQNHHPTILEEDEDMALPRGAQQIVSVPRPSTNTALWNNSTDAQRIRASKSSLVTARMLQGANTATVLKPHIQQYLMSHNPSGNGERTIMILTSKVAQKSYGTEKRFLCPPPTTILSGASWWTNETTSVMTPDGKPNNLINNFYSDTSGKLSPPKLTIHISGEATSQPGVLEWYASNGAVLEGPAAAAAAAASNEIASGDTTMSGKCVSKHLHINDADEKRKRVEVLVKLQLGNGIQLGALASKGIKVISKPSKKRQSVKNMELCIHHGTTISLFNRIRSQTVSTKYLGVSTGDQTKRGTNTNGTCFVARTGSWDPFVIWIVDTSRTPDISTAPLKHHPANPSYPPPPAIAMQIDSSQQPLAIHYNQAVVLQCVTTGLVSPVMVIRKVDKGSMVLGGNRLDDLSGTTGGECGDEAIGDPVSQLHKVAFQIVQDPSIAHSKKANFRHDLVSEINTSDWVLPQTCQPITYLACLNDVVGMHKTTTARAIITSRPQPKDINVPATWIEANSNENNDFVVAHESDGKVVRKRRVSCDVVKPASLPAKLHGSTIAAAHHRRRVNSLNDVPALSARRGSTNSTDHRRGSQDSVHASQQDGACWTEDVSDAAVWTIVGTDCATYTFWTPPPLVQDNQSLNSPFMAFDQSSSTPITPFPVISQITPYSNGDLMIQGENMTRDLAVWFGDIKGPRTDYRSRESITCSAPDLSDLLTSPVITVDEEDGSRRLPILLVRGDGIVYRTGKFYSF